VRILLILLCFFGGIARASTNPTPSNTAKLELTRMPCGPTVGAVLKRAGAGKADLDRFRAATITYQGRHTKACATLLNDTTLGVVTEHGDSFVLPLDIPK
jgi:hypothetical protein